MNPTMHVLEFSSDLECSQSSLFGWHASAGAFERLEPPWSPFADVRRSGGLEAGARTTLVQRIGPLRLTWVAEHLSCDPPHGFRDRQRSGPFAFWEHEHCFTALGRDRARLTDRVRYRLPLDPLGGWIAGAYVRRELEAAFRLRHRVTRWDLERWKGATRLGRGARFAVLGRRDPLLRQVEAFLSAGGALSVLAVASPARPAASVHVAVCDERDAGGAAHWRAALAEATSRDPAPELALAVVLGRASATPAAEDEHLARADHAQARADLAQAWRPWEARGCRTLSLHADAVLDPRLRWGDGLPRGRDAACRWIALEDLLGALLFAIEEPRVRGARLVASGSLSNAETLYAAQAEVRRSRRELPAPGSPAAASASPTRLELEGWRPRLSTPRASWAHAWGHVLESEAQPARRASPCTLAK